MLALRFLREILEKKFHFFQAASSVLLGSEEQQTMWGWQQKH